MDSPSLKWLNIYYEAGTIQFNHYHTWYSHTVIPLSEQVSQKKVTTTIPIVSGQKLDTEETSKQKKLK